MKQKTAVLKNAAIVAFLVGFPHLVPLPFYTYTVVCFLLILYLLRREGETLKDIGLAARGVTIQALFTGLLSGLVWVGFMQLIYIPLILHFFAVPEYTEYNYIRQSVVKLILTLLSAWFIGGFYEETVFRGYIQALLRNRSSSGRTIAASMLGATMLFGLYHWQQGVFGMIAALLGGFYWSILLRKYHYNLWVPVFSHATFDTLTLLLIYFDVFGK